MSHGITFSLINFCFFFFLGLPVLLTFEIASLQPKVPYFRVSRELYAYTERSGCKFNFNLPYKQSLTMTVFEVSHRNIFVVWLLCFPTIVDGVQDETVAVSELENEEI
jgi:hypothetical protein